jgi:4-hydroxy-tetrahydrodipicolinate reductase
MTGPVRALVVGDGKMGRAVAQVAAERGLTVVAVHGPDDMRSGLQPGMADVAIEFTQPDAAAANVRACLNAGMAVVSGTTGWTDELEHVKREVLQHGGALLHAPNFSLGVHVFTRLVEAAARMTSSLRGFDLHLVETHHTAKLDAPSGTAKKLALVAAKAAHRQIAVSSVRVGSVPGTHEFIADGPFEQIRLVHEARDRRVFAEGAVATAEWLVGRHGVFTLDEFMNETLGT